MLESDYVCIQINSGKIGSNAKKIHSSIGVALLKIIPSHFRIVLLGTETDQSWVNFCRDRPRVTNLVGLTSFEQWNDLIFHGRGLLSPDGYGCFFALSQQVPVLMFYEDPEVCQRLYMDWENYLVIAQLRVGLRRLRRSLLLRIGISTDVIFDSSSLGLRGQLLRKFKRLL